MQAKNQNSKKIIMLVAILQVSIMTYAHVSDYVLYDKRLRNNVDELKTIVEVKLNHYYGFADLGLIATVLKDSKVKQKEGCFSSLDYDCDIGNMTILDTTNFYENAKVQLSRNALLIFDVSVIKCLKGSVETNRILVAMKSTRAYDEALEMPIYIGEHFFKTDKTFDLGLVKISKDEFVKSFRELYCCAKDDVGLFERMPKKTVRSRVKINDL